MKTLTAEDENTEKYQTALQTLKLFQDNIELEYIYAINIKENENFSILIDPITENPGKFGDSVVATPALKTAAAGESAVDKKPYQDEWGRFYSAYTPVFDSDGNVAVIVALDCSAEWFEKETSKNVAAIVIVSLISLILGIFLSIAISAKTQRRFETIRQEMRDLNGEFNDLNQLMMRGSIQKLDAITDEGQRELLKTLASGETYGTSEQEDEISEIGNNLHSMQYQLKRYIGFIYSQTYVDEMTGVGNKAAYQVTIRNLEQNIEEHTAEFSVAFFDLNELKAINTNYGFEQGDALMLATAAILKEVFEQKNVYRIASDEFIVVLDHNSVLDMTTKLDKTETEIRKYNMAHADAPPLSIAKGFCTYQPECYEHYRQVFIRAEANMRKDKEEYYRIKQWGE